MLKKVYMWPCKKYLTYYQNFWCTNEGYLHKKHIQISWHWINFYVIYDPKKYSDEQTDKL